MLENTWKDHKKQSGSENSRQTNFQDVVKTIKNLKSHGQAN